MNPGVGGGYGCSPRTQPVGEQAAQLANIPNSSRPPGYPGTSTCLLKCYTKWHSEGGFGKDGEEGRGLISRAGSLL